MIGLVEGLCIGAGAAVAPACNILIAASDTRLAITPAKLGLVYSLPDTKRAVDAIGVSAACDLMFTGLTIDAAAALAIRVVDERLAADDVDETVAAKARQIAESPA